MATAAIPPQARAKQLRACLLCSIIQTPVDFRRNGCPNCEELMQVRVYTFCIISTQKYLLIPRLDERLSRSHSSVHYHVF